ncbi:hypothetical protein C1646_773491 [Rhizophagus diaphanus]|nr:hypothetical protein C1646_773491 [Rhizophagus diaphanus] [Rhizophagus sp. MUCL 43196]
MAKNNYNEIANVSNSLYNNPGFNNISDLDSDDTLVSNYFNETKNWNDDNNSGWDDSEDVGKTPKLTYYIKYDPNGLLTKAVVGIKKITNFFKKSDVQDTDQSSNLNTLEDSSSTLKSDIINPYTYQMIKKNKRIKRTIRKITHNNEHKRIDISLEAVPT